MRVTLGGATEEEVENYRRQVKEAVGVDEIKIVYGIRK